MRSAFLFAAGISLLASPANVAQTAAVDQQPASPPRFTLNVNAQLVIEDVTVTDGKGQPVAGLTKSAFHVFDNNVPQFSFDVQEQTGTTAAVSSSQPSTMYSNAGLLKGTGTMVAVLIDPVTVELQDQLYLRIQALHFVDSLPAGTSVAVFRTNNQGIPVQLQSPTANHALVRQAIAQSVPILARPVDNQFENAVSELENLSEVLRPYPGNKALLWMAGEFPLFVPPDFLTGNDNQPRQQEEIRQAYRALQDARIAVYPIDARGVVQPGGFITPQAMSQTQKDQWANDPSLTPKSLSSQVSGQYDVMDSLASATGGMAFYNNNAVARVMSTALNVAQHAYTISLRPQDTAKNGAWHTMRITVDGPYTTHYRTGYYAEDGAEPSPGSRRLLAAGEESSAKPVQAETANTALPLQFSARVLQDAKAGKDATVNIRYVIPASQLRFDTTAGEEHSRFRITALAYNGWGDILGSVSGIVETHFTTQQKDLAARIGVPADQAINVRKGAQYLILAVEDLKTLKVGTVQLQLSTVQAAVSTAIRDTPAQQP